jgi:hypothetical protein
VFTGISLHIYTNGKIIGSLFLFVTTVNLSFVPRRGASFAIITLSILVGNRLVVGNRPDKVVEQERYEWRK